MISYCLEQGQSYLPDKQTTFQDQYYNNQNSQDEYSVNHPDVNNAATKIQAQFRGYKTRRDLDKIKQNRQLTDSDHEQSTTISDEYQKSSFDKQEFDEIIEGKRYEQERAAIAIQAQFRGFHVRKNLRESFDNTNKQEQISYQQKQKFDNNYDKKPMSSAMRFNDHHDLDENLTVHDEIEAGENDDLDRSQLKRESTQLSEDFERHTRIPRGSSFAREVQIEILNNEDDMSDPNLDKAATRIQASYRGYKTRKELGSSSVGNNSNTGHDQHHSSSISSQTHHEYDTARNKNILAPSVEGNKVLAGEDDDNAAAVKIQAAYRGYRVRKDLEK